MTVVFCLRCPRGRRTREAGFTLVEMLVSVAILGVIMAIILTMTQQTSSLWKKTSGKIEGFRNARIAFDSMTRTISQATLKTYYDYQDSAGNWAGSTSFTSPSKYVRRSDLHFICGQGATLLGGSSTLMPVTHAVFFQSPLGYSNSYPTRQGLLNACGFYLAYGPEPNVPGFLSLSARYRYRLMEFLQPSENMQVYLTTPGAANQNTWFTQPITGSYTTAANYVLAENVVALVVWPKPSTGDQAKGAASLTSDYSYDSRNSSNAPTFNQLPPIVEVAMIVIDEASAIKLGNTSTPPSLTTGAPFSDVTKFSADMTTVQGNLAATPGNSAGNHIPLSFRVFQTEVAIAGAKWSP